MTLARNLADLGNQVDSSGTLGIGGGGTSATTANSGFNALAPSQTSNTNKYLTTNGTNTSWAEVVSGMTVTSITYSGDDQAVDPSNPLPVTINGSNFVAGSLVYVDTIATANSGTSINVTSTSTIVFTPPSGKSANSYNVWVVSPTGTIAILANGILYSGAPSWAGQSTSLNSGATVSIQLTATGDTPLTYSLVSGTLPTGTTLSSSGLISGTTTSEGTFPNIVVMASDPQQQDANITIQITITLGDPYFEYVTLLLTGDGANGVQNNTYVDSSPNNFGFGSNGNITQGSFSPYGNNWGNYFNGSSDYLTCTGQSIAGEFTMEGWFYYTANSFPMPLFGVTTSGGGYLLIPSSGAIAWVLRDSGTQLYTGYSFSPNTWYHIAVTRNSSNLLTVWVNGVAISSNTQTTTYASGTFTVGAQPLIPQYFTGYMSNVRFVNGSCLYTSTFTPSTTPLTAVANTSVLTCQSNRFIDNSSNNYSITVNGTPSVQRFSPFNPTVPYSTATIGGSGYFDGSGDYLNFSSNSAWNFGTGDFTLSSWIYPTTSDTGWQHTIFKVSSLQMFVYNNSLYFNGGGQFNYGSSIKPFAWNYVEICRASGTLYFFINGILVGSIENSTDFSSTSGGYIGWNSGAGYVFGYLSDCRIIKGTALHTSSYTSPTAPVTSVTNTQLLANFTNAGIFDSAMRNDWITNNTAQISTSVKKFGTGSMWFDSSIASSHLQIPMGILNTALNASTFTIETWVYRTTGGGSYQCILSGNSDTMDIVVNGSNMFITSNTSNGTHIIDGAYTQYLPVNTWVHLALVCQEGTYYLYFDGINRATGTGATGNNNRSTDYTTNYTYWLGARGDMYGIGYLDDFRITTGIARYPNGTTFTPPTAAFPTN